jgi:hypothetical protein
VVYTYWRQEQVLWERLAAADPARLRRLKADTALQRAGWIGLAAVAVLSIYVRLPAGALALLLLASLALVAAGTGRYLAARPAARRLVWPEPSADELLARPTGTA